MVICDFNLVCIAVTPHEADPELIVDPDAVLSFAVALQWFQAIAGKKSKIRDYLSGVNLDELSLNNQSKAVEPFGVSAVKNDLRISGSERSNHRA